MFLARGTISIFVLLAMLTSGCKRNESRDMADWSDRPELTVFVAASMSDVLGELAATYEERTGIRVNVSIAATGVLRRQIEAGAACDVFIAADAYEMDRLEAGGWIDVATRCDVAVNQLVVMTCDDSTKNWDTLDCIADSQVGPIAIGDPAYVPAGRYAKRVLVAAGLWETVQGRLILADNVRVACQYVQVGQAGVGLVYATDVVHMSDCRTLLAIDPALTGLVACPATVCKRSPNPQAAADLLDFIAADAQTPIWTARGFSRKSTADALP